MAEKKAAKRSPLLRVAHPVHLVRESTFIKHFPGGEGDNNCPRFFYIRDGFGCALKCDYCYLGRLEFRHPFGAEIDPDVDRLYADLERWMKRLGQLGLILGEVSDAWGWADTLPWVHDRNIELIEMFRAQDRHTLIFLTKTMRVHQHLADVEPTANAVLSWSINATEVAEMYESGAAPPSGRIADAKKCREMGWRVRVRLDPMIPIEGWEAMYTQVAAIVADEIQPEQVTCGSWRPREQDDMFKSVSPELKALLEIGPDGRYRLINRLEMYQLAWRILKDRVPELSLCKEEFDVQSALYNEFGVSHQSCNCLGVPTDLAQPKPPPDDGKVHSPMDE